jgi:ankyrin repeat protein
VKLMGDSAQTCTVRNKENETALDIAMSESGIRMDRISLFLHPSIDLTAKSRKGNTVLHIALINGAHQKVIAHLLKLNPGMLAVKNDDLNLPVMTALDMMTADAKAKWPTKFIEHLVKCTHAVDAHAIPSCRSVLHTSGQRSYYIGTTVLEIALRRQRALSVIKSIVKADKDVLTKYSPAPAYSAAASRYYDTNWHDVDVRQRGTLLLPLHQGVWYRVHPSVLQFLTAAHPVDNVLEWTDVFGNTALHMAIRQQKIDQDRKDDCDAITHRKRNSLNMQTLQYIAKAGEMSLLIQDEQGNTPLHMAIELDSDCDIIKLLIEMSTPPTIPCKKRKLSDMQCEQLFVTQNVALCTPLQLAARDRMYYMELIMQAYPPAMMLTSALGCSPMHTLVSHNFNDISASRIYSLLVMNPGVLLLLDDLNRTPLQVALESMLRDRGQVTEASWLPIIRHLSGVSGNLLTPVQTMQLMHIYGPNMLLPYQFYHMKVRIMEYETSCHVYSPPVVGLLLLEAQDTGGTRDQPI